MLAIVNRGGRASLISTESRTFFIHAQFASSLIGNRIFFLLARSQADCKIARTLLCLAVLSRGRGETEARRFVTVKATTGRARLSENGLTSLAKRFPRRGHTRAPLNRLTTDFLALSISSSLATHAFANYFPLFIAVDYTSILCHEPIEQNSFIVTVTNIYVGQMKRIFVRLPQSVTHLRRFAISVFLFRRIFHYSHTRARAYRTSSSPLFIWLLLLKI